MQKKHANGLFINSSYRRAGLLKTLFHGLRHDREEQEPQETPYEYDDGVLPPLTTWSGDGKGDDSRIKKAASL